MAHLYSRRAALVGSFGLAATGVALLNGCSRTSGAPRASAAPAIDSKPASGTVQLWADGPDGAKLPQLFAEFKKSNPDATLKLTQIPAEEFSSKMTAAITAGKVPDLIYMYVEDQPSLLATKAFDPVPSGLVKADDFFPAIWNNSVVDGTAYGVPWYTFANVTIVRKDLAQEAGVALPKDWSQMKSFCDAMKAQGVQYPLSWAVFWDKYTASQLGVLAAQNGGGLISADHKSWTIDRKENVAALEYFADFMASKYSSPDGPQFLDFVPWMVEGKSAAIFDGGPYFAGFFDQAKGQAWTKANIGYIANPAGPTGTAAAGTGGGSWFVPTAAANKEAAWKFARYMSQPDTQVEWYKVFNNLPAVQSAWENDQLKGDPLLETVRASLSHTAPIPNVPTWSQVGDLIGKQMEAVARGSSSAQAALASAQQQAEAIGTGL